MEPKCFTCKGPFHLASGGLFGHQNTPWCGRCVRTGITLATQRKWYNGAAFEKAASVPPPGGSRGLAAEFAEVLAAVGHLVSGEVALEAAVSHITSGKAEAAAVFRRAGVPVTEKTGGKFGAAGTPCTTWVVGSRTLMMG